jgi:hypothetical protein
VAIHESTHDNLVLLETTTFASQKIREREDLQRILRVHIDAVAPDTFVIAEEFADWEDSSRSIDLLCIDKQANLVVVELKRTEDGGHMELQAIRYAAMVSNMTFADAVNAHANFLSKIGGNPSDAENAILSFLGWDEPRGSEFGQDVRIVLVSANFSKEITTSVLWLNQRELDIRCVRLIPYQFTGKTLLDIQQVLPLPESAEYQIRLRKKAAEERNTKEGGADWTRYDLKIGAKLHSNLYKRQLFLLVVRALAEQGKSVVELQEILPARKFVGVEGKVTGDEFRAIVSEMKTQSGAHYDPRRYYFDDDELFYSNGKTWALSNQWSIRYIPDLDRLILKYPEAKISYSIAAEPPME